MPKFQIRLSTSRTHYYWRLVAATGDVVAVSEMFTTKEAAKEGAETVKRIAPMASIEEE